MLNNKITLSITESILSLNEIDVPVKKVENFVIQQISQLPDYIKLGVKIFNTIFCLYTFIFSLRHPINSSLQTRIFFFKTIRDYKIPIFTSFFRFYQSLIILKALEEDHEQTL
jgi:hypothetical protein